MPGFVIHLAVAKQYLEYHPGEIQNREDFENGIIAPDLDASQNEIERNKSKTHYGKWGNYETEIDLDQFLQDPKVALSQDFWKGYFLHLLTDYYFYERFFQKETFEVKQNQDKFYQDYDVLNSSLISKYDLPFRKDLQKFISFREGTPKYLNLEKILDFIEFVSHLDLTEQQKIIEKQGMEGIKSYEYKN